MFGRGTRRKRRNAKKEPGVKQIDGSVVSWKPEHIALSTAAFDSLPKSGRKLKLHSRTGLNRHEDIQKVVKPLYCLLFIIRVGSIVTSPRSPLPI